MTTILFRARSPGVFLEAAGALAQSARFRGWRATASVPGLENGAAAALGLVLMRGDTQKEDLNPAPQGRDRGPAGQAAPAEAPRAVSEKMAEPQGVDLVFAERGAEEDAPQDRLFFFGGPLRLRVHEGLDAKIAALGAQRGRPLCAGEAREVITEAIACGTVTGAEAFTPASPAAEARLARLLREEKAA